MERSHQQRELSKSVTSLYKVTKPALSAQSKVTPLPLSSNAAVSYHDGAVAAKQAGDAAVGARRYVGNEFWDKVRCHFPGDDGVDVKAASYISHVREGFGHSIEL